MVNRLSYACLLLVCVSLGLLGAGSKAQAQGSIDFAERFEGGAPAGKQCSVSLPEKYSITQRLDDVGCHINSQYFKFNNVESGAVLELWDHRTCGVLRADTRSSDWVFILRTIKQPTTTRWMAVAEIQTADPMNNPIVAAGVQMLFKRVVNSEWDQLSCIRVMRP
ncbi:hypothetical protein SHV42_24835 [Pseudomonas capeferrum]|uniref:hypothetical protein n=1 Tax=Pseudomonas capeferrum TaxID=1495066 RepID=UPI00397E755A